MKIAFIIPTTSYTDRTYAMAFESTENKSILDFLNHQRGAKVIKIEEFSLQKEPLSKVQRRSQIAIIASTAFELGQQYEREQNRKRVNEAEDILD